MKTVKTIIQGHQGSFHDVACQAFFGKDISGITPADSFIELATKLNDDREGLTHGIMAIENSIAGTILQNYKILREYNFSIIGEVNLKIEHCLMCLPDQQLEQITEVHSHPMAINQCRLYLNQFAKLKLVDTEDTALSAKLIAEQLKKGIAAIASKRAAEIYKLKILQENIEDNNQNYTRFFVIQKTTKQQSAYNKASIWLKLNHAKGSLAAVLNEIEKHDINLSKLQSYPILGQLTQYFFHMDLEFENTDNYKQCKAVLKALCLEYKELGTYLRADLSAAINNKLKSVLL